MFGAIPNGNGYRVNYETVSIIDGTENSQAHALTLRRMKIVGDKDLNIDIGKESLLKKVRKQDQEGEGRQYSPRMGFVELTKANGSRITVDDDFSGQLSAVVDVRAGDKLLFDIDPSDISEHKYQRSNNRGGENVDDINSTVEAEQIAADDAMQLGERFAIGNNSSSSLNIKFIIFDESCP